MDTDNQQKLIDTTKEKEEKILERYRGYELKTKNGYRLDEVVSALQKEIRRGNELMAKYWALEMNESGYWRYCFRRMQVISGEDIGLANPEAMILVSSTYASLLMQDKTKRMTSVDNNIIGFVVVYLARSPKSRHIDYLGGVILKRKEKGWKAEIPDYALDMHCERGRLMGIGEDHFFREGSKILKKKHIEDEDEIKKECLELYEYHEKRDENLF